MSEPIKTWSFSAQIERFEKEGSMHFLCIPKSIEDEVRTCPEKRYFITVNDVFLARFDAMLPGKRHNAIHQIASAKTEATVTKRIVNLMANLGLATVLWGWALFACGPLPPVGAPPSKTPAIIFATSRRNCENTLQIYGFPG